MFVGAPGEFLTSTAAAEGPRGMQLGWERVSELARLPVELLAHTKQTSGDAIHARVIMTFLLIGKTLLDRVGACHAPPQDRHRSAPYSPLRSASLRTDLRRIASHR